MNEFISEFTLGDADGPSIALKDTIDVAGYPTTAASRALLDTPPAPSHADVVDRLLDAGLAHSRQDQHARAGVRHDRHQRLHRHAENPQDETRIPGGSSSGSAAAVGLHLVDARARHRHRRLGARSRCVLRRDRHEADFGRVSRRGVAPHEARSIVSDRLRARC